MTPIIINISIIISIISISFCENGGFAGFSKDRLIWCLQLSVDSPLVCVR